MPNIELAKALEMAAEDEFWAVRGKAIQGYASLEQAMSNLFSALGGMGIENGAIIFFKIASADARNKIVEALFRKEFGDQFNLFRKSLFEQLKPIDQERNQIVHWNAACKTGHDGISTTAEVVLTPPAMVSGKRPQIKTTGDIRVFDAKAQFFARLVTMFTMVNCDITEFPMAEDEKAPWHDIFSRPIVCPPPLDHPLFLKPGECIAHIQAFLV
jgi:hypothetical protein